MAQAHEIAAFQYFHRKRNAAIERAATRLGVSNDDVLDHLLAAIVWTNDGSGNAVMRTRRPSTDSIDSSDSSDDGRRALSHLQMLSDVTRAQKTLDRWRTLLGQYRQNRVHYERHPQAELLTSLLSDPRAVSSVWRCLYEATYQALWCTRLVWPKWAPGVRSTRTFVGLTPMERRFALEYEGGWQPAASQPFCTVRQVQRITANTPDDRYIMRTSSRMHNLQVLFAHMSASYNVPYVLCKSASGGGGTAHDEVQDSKCYQCSHDHVLAGTLVAQTRDPTRDQIVCVLRDLQTIRITATANFGQFEVHSLVDPGHSVFRELFGVRSKAGAFSYIEDKKTTWNQIIHYRIRRYDPHGRAGEITRCRVAYNHRMHDVNHFEKFVDASPSPHRATFAVAIRLEHRTLVERETATLVLSQSEHELTCLNDILHSVSYDEDTPKADVHCYAIALDCMDVSYIDLTRTVQTHPSFRDVLYVQESDARPDELVVHLNCKYGKHGIGQDRSVASPPVAYFHFSKYQSHITMCIDVRILFFFDVAITLMLQCINHTPRQPPYTPSSLVEDLNVPRETIESVYMQYADDMAFNSNHIGNIRTNKRFPIILNGQQTFRCMRRFKRHFFMKYPLKAEASRAHAEQMNARIQSSLHEMFFTTPATAGGHDAMPTVSDYRFGSRIIYDATLVPTTIQTSNKKPHFLARAGFPKDGIAPTEGRFLLFNYYSICVALHFAAVDPSGTREGGRDCATYITCVLHPFLASHHGDVERLPPYTRKQLAIMRRYHLEYAPESPMTTRALCAKYPGHYTYDPQSDVDVAMPLVDDLTESQCADGLARLEELVCAWESFSHAHKVMRLRDSVVTDKILIRHLPIRLFTPIVHADLLFDAASRVRACQVGVFSAEHTRYIKALRWLPSTVDRDVPNTVLLDVDADGHASVVRSSFETDPAQMQATLDANDGAPIFRIRHNGAHYDTHPTTTIRMGVCAELDNMNLFTCVFYCARDAWPSRKETDDFRRRFPWFETTHLTTHRVAALQEAFACNVLLLPYDVPQSALQCTPASTAALLETVVHVDAPIAKVAHRPTYIVTEVDRFYEPVLWMGQRGTNDLAEVMESDWTRLLGPAFFERFVANATRAHATRLPPSDARVPAYLVSTDSPRLYPLGDDVYRLQSQHLNEVGNVRSIVAQSSGGGLYLLVPDKPIAPFAIPNAAHPTIETLRGATPVEPPLVDYADAVMSPLRMMRVDYPTDEADTTHAHASGHARYKALFDRLFELCLVKGGYLQHERVEPSFSDSIASHKTAVRSDAMTIDQYVTHVTDDDFDTLLAQWQDADRVASSVWSHDPIVVMHCLEDPSGRLRVTRELARSIAQRITVTKIASGHLDSKSLHRAHHNDDWNRIHETERRLQTWFYMHTFPESLLKPMDNLGWRPVPISTCPVMPTRTHVQHTTPHLLKEHSHIAFAEQPFVYRSGDSSQLWCIYTFRTANDVHAWKQRTGIDVATKTTTSLLPATMQRGVSWTMEVAGEQATTPFIALGFPIASGDMERIMCGRPIVIHAQPDDGSISQPPPPPTTPRTICKSSHQHWLSMVQCFPGDIRALEDDDVETMDDTDVDSVGDEPHDSIEPVETGADQVTALDALPATSTATRPSVIPAAHWQPMPRVSASALFDAFATTRLARRDYGPCWSWSLADVVEVDHIHGDASSTSFRPEPSVGTTHEPGDVDGDGDGSPSLASIEPETTAPATHEPGDVDGVDGVDDLGDGSSSLASIEPDPTAPATHEPGDVDDG